MKILFAILLIPIAAALTSCGKTQASPSSAEAPAPENGAHFKEGKGVALTELMKKSIGLATAEVSEEKLAASFTISVQAPQHGTEASGWLSAAQAKRVKTGMECDLGTAKGTVLRIEKAAYAALGDFEVTVQTAAPIEAGTTIAAVFHFPPGDPVTAIPKSALLTTAEGTFVYAKNDEFYLRTPVKIGAASGEHFEITDGLYTGDEIVTAPVMSLWLAELQVLRGGKSCTCGH